MEEIGVNSGGEIMVEERGLLRMEERLWIASLEKEVEGVEERVGDLPHVCWEGGESIILGGISEGTLVFSEGDRGWGSGGCREEFGVMEGIGLVGRVSGGDAWEECMGRRGNMNGEGWIGIWGKNMGRELRMVLQ